MSIQFSFNYSHWPFVEVDFNQESLEQRISESLKADLVDWANRMDSAFNYATGFTNPRLRDQLNREYIELSKRLTEEGIENYMDPWWNED